MHTNKEEDDVVVIDEKIKKKPAQSQPRPPGYLITDPHHVHVMQSEWLDLNATVKMAKKVLIPDPQFKGNILGKGGETIKELHRFYSCNIYLLGAGSSKDAAVEKDRLNSGDPKYAHYSQPLHLRIECIGTVAEAYEKLAGLTKILTALFSGQVAELNIEDREAMASSSNSFSGHRASNQQTSECYSANTSSYTTIPMDMQQSTSSIPMHQERGSGRGGHVHRGRVQKRDRGDSSGHHSHRGGIGRGGGAREASDSYGDSSAFGRGGDDGFSTSYRGRGGGGGNDFSTSSLRGGGNSGNEFPTSSSARIGRGGGNRGSTSGTEHSATSSLRGRGTESTTSSFRGRGVGH